MITQKRNQWIFLAFLMSSQLSIVACTTSTIPLPQYPTVVYGKVTTVLGTPVDHAKVRVLGYRDSCTSAAYAAEA